MEKVFRELGIRRREIWSILLLKQLEYVFLRSSCFNVHHDNLFFIVNAKEIFLVLIINKRNSLSLIFPKKIWLSHPMWKQKVSQYGGVWWNNEDLSKTCSMICEQEYSC